MRREPGTRRGRADAPITITSVAASLDDQHDARKRKYLIMMGLRLICVIAAVAVYSVSLWLALAFIVGGAVLPWCAVLIANDRPARQSSSFVRFTAPSDQRAITGPRSDPGSDADS